MRRSAIGKRTFDIIVAALILLPLVPFLAAVIVILRITGERQAFYVQRDRIGFQGKKFPLVKFVTMVANSESIGSKDVTVRNDPRVLPVGRVLRKTKVNELPQLLNVLAGHMSIVGWRPLLEPGFKRYETRIQEALVTVKPGLTGIGSIIFRDEERILELSAKPYEECYRDDVLPYKGALELWYLENESLWLDIKIILATAGAVVAPDSAFYTSWFPDIPQPKRSSEITRVRGDFEPEELPGDAAVSPALMQLHRD